jgi:nucleotide-binding universal stress UspA family protein
MMKSILLHIREDRGQDERLAVALDLARAHEAHITCAQIIPYGGYIITDPLGGVYMSETLLDTIETRAQAQRARIEERLATEDVQWDWEVLDGDAAQTLVGRGCLADVLIVSREDERSEGGPPPLPIAAELALHARAPVMVVPPGTDRFDAMGPVMVAWNGSAEAAHSLRLALPSLAIAAQVHLVTVTDDALYFPSTEASRYLARHGIGSVLHEWPRRQRRIAEVLAEAADQLAVTSVVMGAYGHSRFRELILGGATRQLLEQTRLPLLMSH